MSPRRRHAAPAAVLVAVACTCVRADANALPFGSQHLTTFSACSLVVSPSTTTGEADAWVDQKNASTNDGTQNSFNVASNTSGSNQRAYLSFTLGSCLVTPPSTATVLAATLQLQVTKLAPTCRTLDVFRVTGAWAEKTITWNTQPAPATTSANTPASTSRTSSTDVGNVSTCTYHTNNSLVSFDVTADVAAFVSGSATNDGWMIRDDAENGSNNQQTTFTSREGGTLATAPRLFMTYTLG